MATIPATRLPPAAASAEAMPKAYRWIRWTLTPQTMATSRLWEVARMALPSLVFWRNQNAKSVRPTAKAKEISRDLESAKGPTKKEPVRNSTERTSELKAYWVTLTSAIEIPNVRRSEESSGASTTRCPIERWGRAPSRNMSGMETRSERDGLIPRRGDHQKE